MSTMDDDFFDFEAMADEEPPQPESMRRLGLVVAEPVKTGEELNRLERLARDETFVVIFEEEDELTGQINTTEA